MRCSYLVVVVVVVVEVVVVVVVVVVIEVVLVEVVEVNFISNKVQQLHSNEKTAQWNYMSQKS